MNVPILRRKIRQTLSQLRMLPYKQNIPPLICLLLTLLILGPLLTPGFILQFDMIFAPQINLNIESAQMGANLYHNVAVTAVLKLLSFALPVDIIQKIILATIFFVGSYGTYRVLPVSSMIARILGGIIYIANPFVYDRLMAGHWRFLLVYAITPLIVIAFFKFYTSPSRKFLLYAIAWWAAAVLVSAHHLIILGLLFAVLGVLFIRSWRMILLAAAVLMSVLFLNLWWILPATGSPNFTTSFSLDHLYAFATRTDPVHGIWFNMISLQGFWHAGWQSVKNFFVFWPMLVLLWLVPVFIGIAGWRTYIGAHRKLLIELSIAAFVGLLLAAGPHPSIWQLNNWIFTHIPGMSSMRESQKFLALLALAYSFFAAFGINFLVTKYKKMALAVVALSVTATILLAWPVFWGAHGQMRVSQYPDSWYQFQKTLQADETNAKVLILPWSVYTSDTFVNTHVANPARAFFGDRAIVSQRMNLPGVTEWAPLAHRQLEEALENENASLLAEAMQNLNIRYIAITDPHQKGRYKWLFSSQSFEATLFNEKLIIVLLTFR